MDSPLSRLQQLAREHGEQVALVGNDGSGWGWITWTELHSRVGQAAAGMLEAGLRPGQAVVLRVGAGIRTVELELAARVAGAVPVLLPDELAPEDVPGLLGQLDVRLVVADRPARLDLLAGADLDDALLFTCDDLSWDRLVSLGAARLSGEPDLPTLDDSLRDPAATRTVLGLARAKASPWLVRPEASGATTDPRPGDVVLLVGRPADRFTTVVREAHLAAGCTLAWVETPDDLAEALAVVTPTHLWGDHAVAQRMGDLLATAEVGGKVWHDVPRDVLDAACAQVAGVRLTGRARRLAADVTTLRSWWGDRLRQVVLDARVDRTVSALAQVLDFSVGRIAHHPAAPLGPGPAAGGAVEVTEPPAAPVQSTLPRRDRGSLDAAFSLV